jgi:tetratricopeptide (TPR) repeat protein
MSDARLVEAQQALAGGRPQDAMVILKGILQEAPDDMEVRNLLMECQARLMLQLQVTEKLRKAKVLLEQGLRENAEKILQEIVKADPDNQEALDLLKPDPAAGDAEDTASISANEFELPPPMDLPPLEDVTATDEFSMDALPTFGEVPVPSQGPDMASLPELTPLDSLELPGASWGEDATVLSGTGPGLAEQAKIRQYIEEGQALQAQGRIQDAIDIWTRVFILDEQNQDVQGLIDAAKAGMAGNQSEIEHALAEGIAAFNSGQPERARPLLEKVLQAMPGHKEARYYLDRMGTAPAPAPQPFQAPPAEAEGMGFELETDFGAPPSAPAPPLPYSFGASSQPFNPVPTTPMTAPAGPGEFEFDTGPDAGGLFGAPPPAPSPLPAEAPPPIPGLAPEPMPPPAFEPGPLPLPGTTAKVVTASAAHRGPSLGLILGGAAAVLLLAVGIFVTMKFLGREDETGSVPVAPAGGQANKPAAGAIANVPAANAPVPGVPSAPVTAADFIQEARSAMEVKDYIRALGLYQQALTKENDNGEAKAGLDQARSLMVRQQEEEARNQKFIKDYNFSVGAFRDGEYKDALTVAWRLIYPDDKLAQELGKAAAIRRILRDGYYNWAVKDLKMGNAKDAEKNLGEALTIDAGDAGAKSLLQFARKYSDNQPDPPYWETVKPLPLRPFSEGP